jgi:hypothetical protein
MDCAGITYVSSQIAHDPPATDLDFDRHVTTMDLDRFKTCATRAEVPGPIPASGYGFRHDGDIDGDDFAFYQRFYSALSTTADPSCD